MTTNEFEKLNSALKSEANTILHDYGLLEMLGGYGKPTILGSYSLNLMTWRDLDIHLESNQMTIKDFFNLGLDIATRLRPRRMSFRNEFIGNTPNLPRGFYWGIYTKLSFPEEWKIDIWALDSDQAKSLLKRFRDLEKKMSKENRPAILAIKSHFCRHPEYRKSFSSFDIYKSVIEDKIRSPEEFSRWLKNNKRIE